MAPLVLQLHGKKTESSVIRHQSKKIRIHDDKHNKQGAIYIGVERECVDWVTTGLCACVYVLQNKPKKAVTSV